MDEPSSSALRGGAGVRLFDAFFVLRPTLMFPLWTMTLAGCRLAGEDGGLSGLDWGAVSFALTALFGLVYLVNQICDREADRRNRKLFLIDGEAFGKGAVIIEAAVLVVIVIAGLYLAGMLRLWLWMGAIFTVAGVFYNFTPIALESKPWGGVVAGMAGSWLLIQLGGMIAGEAVNILDAAPYILAFTAGCLLTELLDEGGDKQSGRRTFAVRFGAGWTMLASGLGIVAAALWGGVNRDWAIAFPAALSAPFVMLAWLRGRTLPAVLGNKLAIFALSVGVGVRYPAYLAAIALYYPFARWYHRKRFGIRYPSF